MTQNQLQEYCVSNLQIDRWLVDELEADEKRRFDEHCAMCLACRRRRGELAATARAFAAASPPLEVLSAAPPRTARRWSRAAAGAAAALAMAAAALLLMRPEGAGAPPQVASSTRSKGSEARLEVVLASEGAQRLIDSGAVVHPGDLLQLRYTSPRSGYLAVLGRDQTGMISAYYEADGHAAAIVAGSEIALSNAIELDDTLGTETLYGFFCADPVAIKALRGVLEAQPAERVVPTSCELQELSFDKQR